MADDIGGSSHFKPDELVLSNKGGMKCDKLKARWDLAPWKLFRKIIDSITEDEKLRWDLIPFEPIKEVVDIMTYGAKKYKPNNWQKVEFMRYFAAFMRHFIDWFLEGEFLDLESDRQHTSHMLTNAVFMNYLDMEAQKVVKNGKNIKPKG